MTAIRSFEETLAAVADVDGWMSDEQARRLYDAAVTVTEPGLIVEIGSFRGRSTIVLASAASDGVEVVAIDPHAGNDRGPQEIDGFATQAEGDHAVFTRNLANAGVADRVRHVRRYSDAAHADVQGQIDVLYIDGAHRYGPALHDIREWGRRVAPGGTMLIHDSFSSVGVTGAIVRSLVWSKRFTYVGRTRSLTEYRADKPWSRVGNALNQLAQLPWFVKNVALKALMLMRFGPLLRRILGREPQWPY